MVHGIAIIVDRKGIENNKESVEIQGTNTKDILNKHGSKMDGTKYNVEVAKEEEIPEGKLSQNCLLFNLIINNNLIIFN